MATWITNTISTNGCCWDYLYLYFDGDATLPEDPGNWENWDTPRGQPAIDFANRASSFGAVPVYTYYELIATSPSPWQEDKYMDKLTNASTMNAYFENFKFLMQKITESGVPTAILHHEPDLWGFIHEDIIAGSNDPSTVAMQVKGSGHPDAAGYADNVVGFSQALLHIRDIYAPNVVMAIHVSPWVERQLFRADLSQTQLDFYLAKHVAFNGALMVPNRWDVFFMDTHDADADWAWLTNGQNRWWDFTATNTAGLPANFVRSRYVLDELSTGLGMRFFLWQQPNGNTYYKTMNNSNGHYRDNILEYFLPPVSSYSGPGDNSSHIAEYANAGLLGIMFMSGGACCGVVGPWDYKGDGITNPSSQTAGKSPESTWGTAISTYADDDGGYIRLGNAAYCAAGAYPLPRNPTAIYTYTAFPTLTPTTTNHIALNFLPLGRQINFEVTLPQPGAFRLQVFDIMGKETRIFQMFNYFGLSCMSLNYKAVVIAAES